MAWTKAALNTLAVLVLICSQVRGQSGWPLLRRSSSYDSSSHDNDSEDSNDKDKKDKSCQQVLSLGKSQFDLDTYISKTWYVQKQQINPYQGDDDLFCITATYNKRADGRVQVLNAARRGGVNGTATPENTNNAFTGLCAEQLFAGALQVGPCILGFLSSIVYGPYWVIAAGVDEVAHDYSWSIISAGAPDVFIERKKGKNFCTTTNSTCFLDINGSGLWFFTRDMVASEETLQEMFDALDDLGVYAGGLRDVTQEGCTYPSWVKY